MAEGSSNGRKTRAQNPDRISELPDSILLYILSLLPTEDAVKTGTLSHRWYRLWTCVPKLSFLHDCSDAEFIPDEFGDHVDRFVNFVNQTLALHTCCKVRQFDVSFYYDEAYAQSVDQWISFAARANVEDFSLIMQDQDDFSRYVLSEAVYNISSIKTFTLGYCDLVPNGSVSWESLNSLSISSTILGENAIQKILLGSPLLENLNLDDFHCFYKLDFCSASLRNLALSNCVDQATVDGSEWMEISAPKLESLILYGDMNGRMIRLKDIQSLDQCELLFFNSGDYKRYQTMVKQLVDRVGHVKKLTLGSWVFRILLSVLESNEQVFSPPYKCPCLTINCSAGEDNFYGIACLLQNAPCLETLVINIKNTVWSRYSNEDYVNTHKVGRFTYSLMHLKTVRLVGSLGIHWRFELVKFLLEKAIVLEKIVVVLKPEYYLQHRIPEMTKKLLSLPRSSSVSMVVLPE